MISKDFNGLAVNCYGNVLGPKQKQVLQDLSLRNSILPLKEHDLHMQWHMNAYQPIPA